MRYFLDTRQIEHGSMELISLAIVGEDELEYYALSVEYHPHRADPHVRRTVLTHVEDMGSPRWRTLKEIRGDLKRVIGEDKPEFWGDCSAMSWVMLCRLFGGVDSLPRHWPRYCRDVRQAIDCNYIASSALRRPRLLKTSLDGARWAKAAFLIVSTAIANIG